MLRHFSLYKTWFTHYSLSTCSSLCYVCSADHCLYKEVPLLQGRQCTQDLRSIPTVTCERHCQRGSHIQCKHSGINLHRTWIPVTSQCPDDFPGLAVIEHVHDIAVPEGMWCDRNRKCTPSASARFTACFSQLRIVSSVTGHNRLPPAGPGGDHPAFHLPDIAYICQRNRAHFIFGGRPRRARTFSDRIRTNGLTPSGQMIPASASGLRQYAFRYSRGWRTAYGDADPAYRKKGTHFRGQQVGRCGPRGSGHSSQGERCCKIHPGAMGNRETRSGEFCRGMTLFMSYFSRSTRTVYGYRYSDLNARILPRQ